MRGAAVAGEALFRERLMHHAVDRFAEAHQADQRAPGDHAGDEGFGAVDRIEHPDIFGVGMLRAVFLAEDAVLGKIRADQGPHRIFRGAVGGGDRVEAARQLVLDRQRGAEERQDGVARRRGELVDETGEIDRRHSRLFMPLVASWASTYRRLVPAATPPASRADGRAKRLVSRGFCMCTNSSLLRCNFRRSATFCIAIKIAFEFSIQLCKIAWEKALLGLDFCALRCRLLQCGSESYCCPPWAFPP